MASLKKPTSSLVPAGSSAHSRPALELAVSSILKQFGAGSVMCMGANTSLNVERLTTGNLALDEILGGGGLPRGRIVEVYGPESSGKTTLCLQVIAQAQAAGGVAAFVDVEHALDPKWAAKIGVDVASLLVSQPDSGEDALNIAETLIRSGEIDVLVVDSVAALITKAELDGAMGDATMGATARLMSQAMRRLTAVVSKTKCICIFTNQIREKIGVMFGSPETTSGGRALKFFSSVRLDVRRKDTLKDSSGAILGNAIRVKAVKNKVAAPFGECQLEIFYDSGLDSLGPLLDLGVTHKILEKKGSWFSYEGNLVGQGRDAARAAMLADPVMRAEIDTAIRAKLDGARQVVESPTLESPPVAA